MRGHLNKKRTLYSSTIFKQNPSRGLKLVRKPLDSNEISLTKVDVSELIALIEFSFGYDS